MIRAQAAAGRLRHLCVPLLLPLLCTVEIAIAQQELPRAHVIATGGTISNTGGAERLTGEELVRSLPGVERVARITVEQFSNVASGAITHEHWLNLARRINELYASQENVAGIVVTHGTDTAEETAYFLNLTVASCRPVIITGAMRRATDLGADGPANLLNSIRAAVAPDAAAQGTLLLLNNEIFVAREVTKANTSLMDAFVAPGAGPIGVADPDSIVFHREPPRRDCQSAPFDVAALTELPRVDIVYSHIGADSVAIDAAVAAGAQGLVVASVGRGGMTPAQGAALRRARERGVHVVVSSRTGGGRVPVRRGEGSPEPGVAGGVFLGAGELNPQKARILLMLALARTGDPEEIRAILESY